MYLVELQLDEEGDVVMLPLEGCRMAQTLVQIGLEKGLLVKTPAI